jgi:hypothetical protein
MRLLFMAFSNCNSIKGQGHPGGIENNISPVRAYFVPLAVEKSQST